MLNDPGFWVAIAFVVFFMVFGKKLLHSVREGVNDYIRKIDERFEGLAERLSEATDALQKAEEDLTLAQERNRALTSKAKKEIEKMHENSLVQKREIDRKFQEKMEYRKKDVVRRLYNDFTEEVMEAVFKKIEALSLDAGTPKHNEYMRYLLTQLKEKC